MNPPDDLPAGVQAASAAAPWALSTERSQQDHRFDEIELAVQAGLHKSALPYARWLLMGLDLVDSNDPEDAVSAALEKTLRYYDPSLSSFKHYFHMVLRGVCTDMLRRRGRELPTSAVPQWWDERLHMAALSDTAAVEDADMCDRIAAALEVLNLSDAQRDMLGRLMDLLDGAEADPFAGLSGEERKRAMATARQHRKRGAVRVLDEAGVTAEERAAAKLVREHRTLNQAKAASPELDVAGLAKSAERKVLRLFNTDTEDDHDGHA